MRFGFPPARPDVHGRRPGLRRAWRARGRTAFRAWVVRSGDRGLERTIGSPPGLRLLFGALPLPGPGLAGEVLLELREGSGRMRPWTLAFHPEGVAARRGTTTSPRLTVRLALADLVRIAAGQLDPADALLEGRMDLLGSFADATRFGELLSRPRAPGGRPPRRRRTGAAAR